MACYAATEDHNLGAKESETGQRFAVSIDYASIPVDDT
jgi:hypothetical protein